MGSGLWYIWVAIGNAGYGSGYDILFCPMVTIHIKLFYNGQWVICFLVLVALDVQDSHNRWVALSYCTFKGQIDIVVIRCHLIGSDNGGHQFFCGFSDYANVIAVTIDGRILELVGTKAINIMSKEEEGC